VGQDSAVERTECICWLVLVVSLNVGANRQGKLLPWVIRHDRLIAISSTQMAVSHSVWVWLLKTRGVRQVERSQTIPSIMTTSVHRILRSVINDALLRTVHFIYKCGHITGRSGKV